MMERCDLTQVPCRKAIAEVTKENKNRYFLQRTYEVAKILLDGSKEESHKKMSEEDRDRFFLIWNILSLNNGDDIRRMLNLSNYLLVRGVEEKEKSQEE